MLSVCEDSACFSGSSRLYWRCVILVISPLTDVHRNEATPSCCDFLREEGFEMRYKSTSRGIKHHSSCLLASDGWQESGRSHGIPHG